jgi:hypothetical protein
MATWTLTAQLTTGTLSVASTDRVSYNGTLFGDNIVVGAYQDSTHILNNTGEPGGHLCTTNHVNNTKYVTSTTVAINGAGATTLAAGTVPTTAQCGLKFNFSDAASVATSAGKFYFYNGTTDATPMAGVTPQCGEGGQTTTWVNANGLGAALTLANQSAATSHDFFIFSSVSPTSTGSKTGAMKISLTYV